MKGDLINAFITALMQQESILTEFDEMLWHSVIDKVTVGVDGSMEFNYKKD